MNKRCVALTDEQYKQSIELLRYGFLLEDKTVKPNERIAAIAVTQASLGLRLGDVLRLRLSSFVRDGGRWRLNIREQKTDKLREFTVPVEVCSFLQDYAVSRGISREARLFAVSERQVERHLNKVFTKMGLPLEQYGSHSYRKLFATRIYLDSDYNVELVRVLLQHSSIQITQRYIGVGSRQIEEALAGAAAHVL